MATFLGIMLTLVISLIIGFLGAFIFIVWLLSENKGFRDYFKNVIKDFEDEEDDELDSD